MDSLTNLHLQYPRLLLLAIPLLILVPLIAWPRLRSMPVAQRLVVVGLRLAVLLLLIAALAGPALIDTYSTRSVVLAVDVSDSMHAEQQQWARDWAAEAAALLAGEAQTAVIEFGAYPQVTNLETPDVAAPDGTSTDLPAALRLAQSLTLTINGGQPEIVVITDGWANTTEGMELTGQVQAGGGSRISFVRPDASGPEALLASLDIAPEIMTGDRLDLAAFILSSEEMDSRVRVWLDEQVVADSEVTLLAGRNQFRFAPDTHASGIHRIRVEIEPERDTLASNNALETGVVADDPGRVLVLENRAGEGRAIADKLASGGIQVDTRLAESIPPSAEQLDEFAGIILVNTPATNLTLDQQATLQIFVRDLGRGLLVIGGPLSYGAGAYQNTVLGELLPVSSEPPDKPVRGNVAIFVVLDRSASMEGANTVPSKLAMARQAAIEAAGLLQPDDLIGVVAFDTRFDWVVPATRIGGADDIAQVQERITTIASGGGTAILPALETAYAAAREADARHKHILLLSDGRSTGAGFEELVDSMSDEQITLSTVAIGEDSDTDLLATLAERGQGRYYFTERSEQIPRIANREATIVTQETIVEGDLSALPGDPSALLRGVGSDFPALAGYVATTPREHAITALQTSRDDPLLAHWQYGLGRVVAWTSDSSIEGWGQAWVTGSWADSSRLWPQIARWTMPAPSDPNFRLSAEVDPHGREVSLRAESLSAEGHFENGRDTRATIASPDGTVRELPLFQAGPGMYQQALTLEQAGVYRVLVRQDGDNGVAHEDVVAFAIPEVGIEQRTIGVNDALLIQIAELSGGRELTTPADLLGGGGAVVRERLTPIWPWFVGLALVLLLFDIAARRLIWRRRIRLLTSSQVDAGIETSSRTSPHVSSPDQNTM